MAQISKEYGAALFMLACERDSKSEYGKALENVKSVFEQNPAYIEFLASPGIAKSERLEAVESAFGGNFPEDVVSFLQLLIEKGRMSCFFEAQEEYQNLLDASEHIQTAKISSAVELTADEKDALKKKLEAMSKNMVNMEYFIDESLLGGVVVEIDGRIIDGSLRKSLSDIKEVINT